MTARARPVRRILVTMTLCAAIGGLSGCVLAVGNGDAGDEMSWHSSEYRNNDLAHSVRTALETDAATRDADLSVYAEHGHIYLEGTVHSADVLTKAVQIALATPEVKSVRCRITVLR